MSNVQPPEAQPQVLGLTAEELGDRSKLLKELSHIRGIILDIFTHEHPFYNEWLERTVEDPYQISEMLKAFLVWNNQEFTKRLAEITYTAQHETEKWRHDFNEIQRNMEAVNATNYELEEENQSLENLLVECANRLVPTDGTITDPFIGKLVTITARMITKTKEE